MAAKKSCTLLINQRQYNFPNTQIEAKVEEDIAVMESQFAKIEVDYSKKIRELKGLLGERTRRQHNLNSEVARLREEYCLHRIEVNQLTALLKAKQQQAKNKIDLSQLSSNSPEIHKISMSPPTIASITASFNKSSNESHCIKAEESLNVVVRKRQIPCSPLSKVQFSKFNKSEQVLAKNDNQAKLIKVSNPEIQKSLAIYKKPRSPKNNESKKSNGILKKQEKSPRTNKPLEITVQVNKNTLSANSNEKKLPLGKRKAISPKVSFTPIMAKRKSSPNSIAQYKGLYEKSLKSFEKEKPKAAVNCTTSRSGHLINENSKSTQANRQKLMLLKETEFFQAF